MPHLTLAMRALILLAAVIAAPVRAADWGPSIGTEIPAGLAATTPAGETVQLRSLAAGRNGLVVAFVRSADWCPFCMRQLVELSARHDDFAARDLTLVSVSYDPVAVTQAFTREQDLAFTMLSDPDSRVIDAFGIRNTEQEPGSPGDGIPYPGIMVFDASGRLVLKFAEPSYRDRPAIDDVIAAIDAR